MLCLRQHRTVANNADADDVDVRTVRKHLDLARREREVREARTSLLRDALKDHYQDMLALVELIDSSISDESAFDLDSSEDLRLESMRQHIPRSPIWNNLRKFNDTLGIINDMKVHSKNLIKVEVEKEVRRLSIGSTDMIEGLIGVFGHQLEQWVRGNRGLKLSESFVIESQNDDEVLVRYGFSHMGWIKKKDLETLKKMISDFEVWIRDLDIVKSTESKCNSLKIIGKRIRKELAGIRMRRIFAGKCKYCPI